MYILHECVALSTSQNYIVEDVDEEPRWRLIVSKLITAEDLENNHYLEILGDVLEQIDLPVNYCPYCGVHLDNNETVEVSYTHRDYSKG